MGGMLDEAVKGRPRNTPAGAAGADVVPSRSELRGLTVVGLTDVNLAHGG